MKWTYEPGELFPVLALTQSEVKQLIEILKGKVRSEVERKYEKYHDIHEGGEATERQCALMDKYEEQLSFIDRILKV
jgi:hypothetical protein